ncbi:MAG: hypothetical protein K8H86_08895 [Ignavibacteriaceae bacterium]|nr:hypothetical protein [Ignavibacteriaceae bacterium]
MEVNQFQDTFENITPKYKPSEKINKIVLVSDAYVTNDIFKDCDFAVTDTIDFRSIVTTNKTTKFSSLSRDGKKEDELKKSNKYNFFKRGSVFYGENLDDITKHLKKPYLNKIGYNHFKIVEKKEA